MRRMPDTLFHKHADLQGIPFRSLEQVRDTLEIAKKTNADSAMARIMLRYGRLTDEARDYVAREYSL